jgi:uncharacterized protein
VSRPIRALRYPLAVDPPLGRLAIESDHAAHVDQLVRQVLLTGPGERVNRPDFGCGLRQMVFAPNSEVTATLAQVTVLQALQEWLGEVIDVDGVQVTAIEERLELVVAYVIRATQERRYLNLEVAV